MFKKPKHLPEPQSPQQETKPVDFFISYTSKDRQWGEWIAFELELAGYITVLQAWDSLPGMNFVQMMNEATITSKHTIVVLSEAYLQSKFGFAEWAVAFREDPMGKEGRVLPVRIEECQVKGLLGPIAYIDLAGQGEAKAREILLAGVMRKRAKPPSIAFPGSS